MHYIKKMEFFYIILIGISEYVTEVFNNLKNEHLWTIQSLVSFEP